MRTGESFFSTKSKLPQLPLLLLLSLLIIVEVRESECSPQTKTFHSNVLNYKLTIQRLNNLQPVLGEPEGNSEFNYNYNAAYLPLMNVENNNLEGKFLLVRCQQNTSQNYNPPNEYAVSPSFLSITNFTTTPFNATSPPINFDFDDITSSSVVFYPSTWYETAGTEDPRVIYRPSTRLYYLLYTAVQNVENPITHATSINVRLSLATAKSPTGPWQRHGPIFKDNNGTQWSKSGSLLCRDGYSGPSYLFYGDSTDVPGLQLSLTNDLLHYVRVPGVWMPIRYDSFDSYLVEAGPMPLLLSDGNYLFIYNSARSGYPSNKPGYDLQYNVGWAVLDGNDPTKILDRASDPLLSPELDWEIGANSLTPNVVFCEGWEQIEENKFILYYGAADTVVGAALLTVDIL